MRLSSNKLLLIAGPCVIETNELTLEVAEKLKNITEKLNVDLVFKASFDKANRTSVDSFRGPGLEKGLSILSDVKSKFNLKLITDIHESFQAEPAAEVVDIIQIPAFLCRQTDLLIAAARTGRTVNVKKAQFLSPNDMKYVVKKIEDCGNKNILLTERGTSFGYNNLVVDMTSIIEMKKFGYPIVFDATHSVQKPGEKGDSTGGNREYAPYLAKAAIAMGADALFMEVHPDPDNAKSDVANMIKLDSIENMLKDILKIYNAVKES